MNSKCKEIFIELMALEKSKVFYNLKHESIFEEAGLASSSNTEKKVYKHDEELVQKGYLLLIALVRNAFVNDDSKIDSQLFQIYALFERISSAHDINLLVGSFSEAAMMIANRCLVRKCETFNSITDTYDIINKYRFKIAFDVDAFEIDEKVDELVKIYNGLSKIKILNLAIERNQKWIDSHNKIWENDKVDCTPIEIEDVSEEERNNVEPEFSKCMNGMKQNFINSMKQNKKAEEN